MTAPAASAPVVGENAPSSTNPNPNSNAGNPKKEKKAGKKDKTAASAAEGSHPLEVLFSPISPYTYFCHALHTKYI